MRAKSQQTPALAGRKRQRGRYRKKDSQEETKAWSRENNIDQTLYSSCQRETDREEKRDIEEG